jgi:hypothetical protein
MTPVDPRSILPILKQLQLRHQIQSYSALLGGAVLSLLGPMLLMLFCLLFSTTLMASYGFWGAYWIIAGVSLPVFFLIAYRLRGSVLEHMVPDEDSLSGRFMQRKVAPLLVIAEMANIGPRLVLWAIERMLGHRRVRGVGLGRIAQAVGELANAHEGIGPAKLLFPDESPRQLEPIIAFMLYHQIADLSKRADRVWLTSDFRRRLQAATKIQRN